MHDPRASLSEYEPGSVANWAMIRSPAWKANRTATSSSELISWSSRSSETATGSAVMWMNARRWGHVDRWLLDPTS